MKNRKVMALLLSIALSISTCVPLGSITALGAETGSTVEAAVQVDDSSSEEAAETAEEADSSSEAATVEEEKSDDNDEVLPENSQEETVSSEEVDTAGEAEETDTETVDANASDETEADLPVLETEPSETESEAAENEGEPAASDETLEPAAETPAADNPVITAPAETETVKTDAQYAGNGIDSDDMSNAIEIKVGDVRNVKLTEDDEYIMYRFVPEETAGYIFYSTDAHVADDESYAMLYSDDGEEIETSSRTDDYGAFELQHILEKGETYYFKTFVYAYQAGRYTIHLEKNDFSCEIIGSSYRGLSPNEEVTLEVSAVSPSAISYQWFDFESNQIEGATSSVYTFTPQKSGEYFCNISDESGNSARLYFDIVIVNHLNLYPEGEGEYGYSKDIYVPAGNSVELKACVEADDITQLTYTWEDENYNPIETSNSPSYVIDSVMSCQSYHLYVSDQYGNSDHVSFNIYVDNQLNVYPEGESESSDYKSIYVSDGESVELKINVSAVDMSQLTYTWSDDFIGDFTPDTPLSYRTDPIHRKQTIYVRVKDQFGNSDDVEFILCVENHLSAYPEGESEKSDEKYIIISTGQAATLKAIVSADNEDKLSYSWYQEEKDEEIGENRYSKYVGGESPVFTTEPLIYDQSYELRIRDKYYNYKYVYFHVFVIDLQEQAISAEDKMSLVYGDSGTISVSGAHGELSYTSNNPSVASVDNTGKVTANKVGTAEIEVYAAATDTYNQSNTFTITVTVTGVSMSNAVVSGIKDKTYSSNALTQAPVVKIGSIILTAGTDYTVSYKNNTNAGTATVTITGKGNYTGTKTVTFKISKAAQSIAVKASSASIAVGKKATVSITGSKGTKSYKSSNTAVATVNATGTVVARKVGTVTITATSAATANYNAASKAVTIKVLPAATSSITAANQAAGIKLTWKKVAGATGYKVYRGATLIKTIKSGTTVTCTDTKANTNGTKYTFKVVPTAPTGNGLAKTLTTYRVARPAVSSVKNTAAKKMTVRWKKNAKANGYQIQYSMNKKFAKGNKTINITKAATVSRVIAGLTKGKTYYVRIRTYKTVGKVKYWSVWSPAKSVKISK